MNTADFDYQLDKERIAYYPCDRRDESRLMVLDRKQGTIDHKVFTDVSEFLGAGDCLVLNDTKVIPARLFGESSKGNAKVEVFVLRQSESQVWEVLMRPGKKARPGATIKLGENGLAAKVLETDAPGPRRIRINKPDSYFRDFMYQHGHMPLPPYIKREDEALDRERYQTVYAQTDGSVAAPTAGLHFTDQLISTIKAKGVAVVMVTLHVGTGTFKPVTSDMVEEHQLDKEYYSISQEAIDAVTACKEKGKKVWAVGTTTTRVLETLAGKGKRETAEGWTGLYIYPGFKFRMVDNLITNFHLPRSSLLMLVSALAGTELIRKAYSEAQEKNYRFYSYGDAMLIK